ncbi:MAG: YggS family pyridoxal phosphate-dependent enzyme [Clostridiales Family XIII bacterium]|jgi:pyridoxal phosphate enzyme (YggS family)|nr:YggS family pyridoxal phosphate-dependent enzyme [Clostridiales Family XIII bacterium]
MDEENVNDTYKSNMDTSIKEIRSRIESACARSGRDPNDILLLAVSKTRTASEIMPAIELGLHELGENKVQEITAKYDEINERASALNDAPSVKWHMIGHLQRNKVRQIIGKVSLIHGVDSLALAEEIDKRAAALELPTPVDILIQVNVSEEDSKSGVAAGDAIQLVREITAHCGHLRVRGLMTIAMAVDDPEDARGYFRKTRQLLEQIKDNLPSIGADMDILSMGMSGDFEVAIEEGSTIVRIGTAIFGRRK